MAKRRSKRKRTGVQGRSTGRSSKAGARKRTAAGAKLRPSRRRPAGVRERTPAPSSPPEAVRQKHPGRPEQIEAFFDARHAPDAMAEELGESFVLGVTSGEDSEEHYDRELPEEDGGPFLETSARTEFAYGVDESNPEDAEPAPWPAVSPGQPPPHRAGEPR